MLSRLIGLARLSDRQELARALLRQRVVLSQHWADDQIEHVHLWQLLAFPIADMRSQSEEWNRVKN